MDINKIDFNLVKPFMMVFEHRSVIEAAQHLDAQPSWVSRRLRQMRELTGDQLFTQEGKNFVPTSRAMKIAAHFSQALSHFDNAFNVIGTEYPFHSASRTFRIALDDYADRIIIPSFQTELEEREASPEIKIFTSNLPDADRLKWNLPEQLQSSFIDLAILSQPLESNSTLSEALLEDEWILFGNQSDFAMSADQVCDPIKLSARQIQNMQIVLPTDSPLIETLKSKNKQAIQALCPFYQSVPERVVQGPGRLGHLPRKLAEIYFDEFGFVEVIDPYKIPKLSLRLHWAVTQQNDPAIKWIVKMISDHCSEL